MALSGKGGGDGGIDMPLGLDLGIERPADIEKHCTNAHEVCPYRCVVGARHHSAETMQWTWPCHALQNPGVAEESSVTFERDCVERITAGDALSDAERRRFAALLEERERSGLPLLGRFAGTDGSLDTVSGRCGVRPPFADIASEA